MGYCVQPTNGTEDGEKKDLSCCQINSEFPYGREADTDIFCFQPRQHIHLPRVHFVSKIQNMRCLNVYKTMNATTHRRCQIDADCADKKCMIPYDPEIEARVTRLTFTTLEEETGVVVYIGNPQNIIKSSNFVD